MLVQRLQRTLRRSKVRLPYCALHTAVVRLQARIRAREARLTYMLLARGWKRRPELGDEKKLLRQDFEDEEQHAQRLREWQRERVWVERFLEEEAVEEGIQVSTGEVLWMRVLSHQEYLALLGHGQDSRVVSETAVDHSQPAEELSLTVRVVGARYVRAVAAKEACNLLVFSCCFGMRSDGHCMVQGIEGHGSQRV